MNHFEDLNVLIICYRRYQNVAKILDFCISLGINNFFISIDGPKDIQSQLDINKVYEVCLKYKERNDITLRIKRNRINFGCAVNVATSCDWFFSEVDFGVVLEDDCIPTFDFFKFVKHAKCYLKNSPDLLMICGSQFAPVESSNMYISKYPLIWGWATYSENWTDLSKVLRLKEYKKALFSFSAENSYWKAAERRAREGVTDVWDSILVSYAISNKKYVLSPHRNLVVNLGFDQFATNTTDSNNFMNLPTGTFKPLSTIPNKDLSMDRWLKNNLYKIRIRHVFTTKYTFLRDKIKKVKLFDLNLASRIHIASTNYRIE